MVFGALIIGDEILSGKRSDRHFARIADLLEARGLRLSWVEYLRDDSARIAASLRRSAGVSVDSSASSRPRSSSQIRPPSRIGKA